MRTDFNGFPDRTKSRIAATAVLLAALGGLLASRGANSEPAARKSSPGILTGEGARGDWTMDAPGVRRRITVADLPAPYASKSVDNGAKLIPRPADAWPKVLPGFRVDLFAEGLTNPREIITAPNGDLFIAQSEPGQIVVLRAKDGARKAETTSIFAEGLELPFGMAFYPPGPNPQFLYVGNTGAVVRFPYHNGDLKASGPLQVIVPDIPNGGQLRGGGHWTRDVRFSRDGKKMFVSVGSHSNVDDDAQEERRADVLEYNPDGTGYRRYAWGIRNAVGLVINPETGALWGSVNERDELGDDLVPDYITSIQDGAFYGWPWYYLGDHQDPRHEGKYPELKGHVTVPDVLLQSHSASLGMVFYGGKQFPHEYFHDAFAAEHGSWNRAKRTGYKLIRVPMRRGKALGEYEYFMTGFVTAEGNVWGRPVGVTVAHDGSLLVTDDGGKVVWRISYERGSGPGPAEIPPA